MIHSLCQPPVKQSSWVDIGYFACQLMHIRRLSDAPPTHTAHQSQSLQVASRLTANNSKKVSRDVNVLLEPVTYRNITGATRCAKTDFHKVYFHEPQHPCLLHDSERWTSGEKLTRRLQVGDMVPRPSREGCPYSKTAGRVRGDRKVLEV